LLAFVPLYILGLMGATRRLDHYSASLGWQPLFIVAGIGVVIIAAGVGFQVLQLIVSILQRNQNRDTTGDPWNGRTLEWSVSSPAPIYNFATLPVVDGRDSFWEMKQAKHKPETPAYASIAVPKNSPLGLLVASFAFCFGFAMIWHITWLAIIGLLGVIVTAIVRTTSDDNERHIPAATVAKIEAAGRQNV
jgi:cytochrome o ubiquinol oxidase subunit 1